MTANLRALTTDLAVMLKTREQVRTTFVHIRIG
jgi:hypothetical protein